MKIDIWSDMVCPFCYIGKRRLEKALDQVELKDADILFHAFELNPQSPKKLDISIHQALAEKYGMTLEQAKAANQRVGDMARGEGLEYNFETMQYTNTFDAHRLCFLAEKEGKAKELTELLMEAYFIEGKLISDHQTLSDLAVEAGLDPIPVKELLESDKFAEEVRQDEAKARQRQISGVPYFVFNDNTALSGAQPTEEFVKALQEATV